jgi:hypothetical protein
MFGLGLPGSAYAVIGCGNNYLQGTYSAQITSANYQGLLSALNTSTTGTGSSGTTTTGGAGSTGTTGTGTTTTAIGPQAGFGNNPNSIAGAIQGLGSFYFDGNGNILGWNAATSTYTPLGTYTVNDDCTGSMQLTAGQTFNAVVAQTGNQIMFLETDANGAGAVGTFQRSRATCSAITGNESFAFSFYGAHPVSSSTSGTGTSGTGTTTTAMTTYAPYSAVGSLTLTPTGFIINGWGNQNGTVGPFMAAGAYTVGYNCSLQLNLSNSNSTSATTSAFPAPAALSGILVNTTSGLISLQTSNNSTITGQFIAQ